MPNPPELTYFPTRRSSDLRLRRCVELQPRLPRRVWRQPTRLPDAKLTWAVGPASLPASPLRAGFLSALALARRSEEHTSELQSLRHPVCRLLLEKKNNSAK